MLGGLLFLNRQRQVGGNTSSLVTSSGGIIVAEAADYDFGTVPMHDGDVEHIYQLANDGNEVVTLGELYTSCMCTTAQVIFRDETESRIAGMRGHGAPTYVNRKIAPGEQFQLKAIFDPAAHGPQGVGPVNRTVYLQTNSKDSPTVELNFEAVVVR